MTFSLPATDGFSLTASAGFAHEFPGTRTSEADPGTLSYAWALDGDWRTARVQLRQDGNQVHGEIVGPHPRDLTSRVKHDVERILCLDVDGSGFVELGRHDKVIAELQQRFPGLRPVLFYTPYESAAWCIIGQRIQMSQAARIKARLADDYGEHGAFPAPERLLAIEAPQRGLTETKIEQLHQLARAALDGVLDRDRLRALAYDEAEKQLRQLPGIGPFSAELILVRGMGSADALPRHEKRLEAATRSAYGLAPDEDIAGVAEGWRPYRSWVGLLLRAAQ